jgi:hypothetical protein
MVEPVDPEFDHTTERGREDINDDTNEVDTERNRSHQEQSALDYERRMNEVKETARIRELRNKERANPTGTHEVIEMFDNSERLGENDMKILEPTSGEKSNFDGWFKRASKYLSEKGAKFKHGMSKVFFERRTQAGYQRLPDTEDAGDGDADVVASGTNDALARVGEEKEEAFEYITDKFPEMSKDTQPPFFYRKDDAGNVEVMAKRGGKKWHAINDYDKIGFPKTIREYLGKENEEVVDGIEDDINKREVKRKKLEEVALDDNEDVETRANAARKAAQLNDEKERLEWEKEKLERKMSTRYKVRRIFKKYGFTVAAIFAAVATVIGAIVSNLKSGLGKIAKGMGNGLKELGKKLGQVLPGIVGAIASFIFKTAGEALGFLAKNAWLLIVAVVLYAIDQIKGRSRSKKYR